MDTSYSLASKNYLNSIDVVQPTESNAKSENGTASFAQVANDLVTSLQNGERIAISGMQGSADTHSVVKALAQTELAIETAVTVRDKVVEAYQEILRMPV